MRIRTLLAVGLVTAASTLALANPAHAAGDKALQVGECKGAEAEELIEASTSGDYGLANELLEDCYSSESPIIPKWSEVIWGGIAWLVVMLLVGKFALPQLKKTMQARSDKIRGDLEAAEAAKVSANMELEQYRAQLADARNEANRIVDAARADAETVKRDLLANAENEAAQIRARAQADIALAQDRALADLRTQVASMSVDLAGKIVERNLDAGAQQDLIDSYINSVGSN